MKFVHLKNLLIMCLYEQEQVQKRTMRSRKIHDDENFKIAKTRYMYIQDQDFDTYQKALRVISHR